MLGMEGEGRECPGRRGQRPVPCTAPELRRAGGEITLLGSRRITVASGAGDTDSRYATRGVRVL